jgi:pimeloyl-ACP methyl ester carboxylesterase
MPELERDGVPLAYGDSGEGDPPVVLLHAWGGDRTWMREQADDLSKRHRVVSPDFRGFGESAKPEQNYTVGGFADDIAWMVEQLQLTKPVIIGHSMGGSVALEIAARHPDLASAIIILEALVVAPVELVDGFRPVLDAIKTDAFTPALTQLTNQLTGPFFAEDQRKQMVETITQQRPDVMISSLQDLLDNDSTAAAAECKVPTLYVASGPWYTDVARFKELCPALTTAQLVGCGHYFTLEVPEQVNPVINRFIQTNVVSPSA